MLPKLCDHVCRAEQLCHTDEHVMPWQSTLSVWPQSYHCSNAFGPPSVKDPVPDAYPVSGQPRWTCTLYKT